MLDYLIRGGTVVDGTGAPGLPRPTSASATAASSPSATIDEDAARDHRRRRPRRRARLRRPAHALRRAAVLGPVRVAVERARRHDDHRRQLRLHARAARRRRRRLPPPHDGQGRGHAARRARDRACRGTGRRFGEYLDALDGNVGVNAGFLVGHCALRRYVMGADAVGNEATPEQLDAMARAAARVASRPAASASRPRSSYTHSDGDGNPVASRWATPRRGARAVRARSREHEGTTLEGVDRRLPRRSSATTRSSCSPTCRSPAGGRSTGTCSPSTRACPSATATSSRRARTRASAGGARRRARRCRCSSR